MSNYHNNPPPLFGLSNAAFLQRESADDQPVDFGLYNGLYGGPDHPLIARHDPQGRVTGWTPILRLQPWQYVACPPISNGPQLGDPYELGVQPDAVGGCGIFFGPWDRVANRICHEAFAAVSQGMPQHPLEGLLLARFVTVLAPKFAAASPSEFDPAQVASQLADFEKIGAKIQCQNSGWLNCPPPPRPTGGWTMTMGGG